MIRLLGIRCLILPSKPFLLYVTLTPMRSTSTAPSRSRSHFPPALPPSQCVSLHDISARDLVIAMQSAQLGRLSDTVPVLPPTLEANGPNVQETEQPDDATTPSSGGTLLANATTSSDDLHPANLRRLMSTASSRFNLNIREANMHYSISQHSRFRGHALIDHGANGGIAGSDCRVIERTDHVVAVQGIDGHELTDIPIVTAGAVVPSQHGDVIAIFHQYAYFGRGKSIHAPVQLEAYKQDVNDKAHSVPGGQQRIKTVDGYVHPLKFRAGLPHISTRPYTDLEWNTLPHVIWTSESTWDPTIFDNDFDDEPCWYDALQDLESDPNTNLFDEFGDYGMREVSSAKFPSKVKESDDDAQDYGEIEPSTLKAEDLLDLSQFPFDPGGVDDDGLQISSLQVLEKEPNYELFRSRFGWASIDTIKKTFKNSIQLGRISGFEYLKKRYKSPNPVLNVHRQDEPVATDTVYSDTPAIDSGVTSAQIFVGTQSLVTNVYPMKRDKQFVNTRLDNIVDRGAPTKLISDRAQVEISNKVLDVLRNLIIGSWQSSPHNQHQNPAERRYQTVKKTANIILDRSGSPAYTWLLCILHVCYILNRIYTESIHGIPIQKATGRTSDMSPLLPFEWWEDVYFTVDSTPFLSESRERRGKWVGVAEHVGHKMTWKVLTNDTKKIMYTATV